MKRIIRLTESDLTRIVKRVILERREELPQSIPYKIINVNNNKVIEKGDAMWNEDFNSYQAMLKEEPTTDTITAEFKFDTKMLSDIPDDGVGGNGEGQGYGDKVFIHDIEVDSIWEGKAYIMFDVRDSDKKIGFNVLGSYNN